MPQEADIDVGDTEEDSVVVDVLPEEDSSGGDVPPEPARVSKNSEGELEDYSSGVKSRINDLTKRFREEERQKQSAIQYAENVQQENAALKGRIEALDKGYLDQFDGRVSSELETTKRVLREAHETGDVDGIVEAQEALINLTSQKSSSKVARTAPPEVPQPAAPAAPAAVSPDPKAEAWAADNDWFGNDEVMTYGAFGIHRRMVEDEGFDPASNEYYTELDSRIRDEFPNKFDSKAKSNGGRKVASAESSASRNKSGRKTVRLTPSQVAIAKKLNVPLEEYAKYVRD
jgi:hypothetical protein|tara:strand:+ start:1067 stop:1930 length:864 start_codon:yes stop_codon:yes gene_type:complete